MQSRRIVLFSLLLILSVSQAYADGAVGFFGGLNMGNLSGDSLPNTSYKGRTGLVVGVMGEFRIAKDVMLGLHPMYVQKGSTPTISPVTEDGDPIENDLRLDYLSVPVLAKIESGNGVTYVTGGLDLAFLMDASLTTSQGESDVKDLLQDIDLSMVFGFGAKIPLGAPLLTLEFRYTQSLLNVADIQGGEYKRGLPVRFRSSGFQLLAGLVFPLGAR
jgi:hypothetical protein